MKTLEGIRYLIYLDSAEIKLNLVGWSVPPGKAEPEVDTT